MTYLVTGATGFIGSAVARQLVAAGHDVRAIVRTPAKAEALSALGVELHSGDITDKASMRRPMMGVDGVFHLAGWYKIGDPDRRTAVAINVDGTRHVLELMRELGVPKGVYTSTLAVNSDTHGRVVDETYRYDGPHLSLYDETKAAAHRLAEAEMAQGLPLVIVQPGLVYGPGDTSTVRTTLRQFLQRRLPVVPRHTAFAWGHVDDVAQGHLLAMENGEAGRKYFVCGPVHTLEDAIDLASSLTGIPAPRLRPGPMAMRAMAASMSVIERVIPLPASYRAESLRILAGVTYIGSNARARRELEWAPRPLRDGLDETLKHELQQPDLNARR